MNNIYIYTHVVLFCLQDRGGHPSRMTPTTALAEPLYRKS